MISDKKWEKMTTYEQNKLLEENGRWRYWKESQKASIQLGGRFLKKSIRIFTDKYNAYSGKHNFLCNTGYSEKGRHTTPSPLKIQEFTALTALRYTLSQ